MKNRKYIVDHFPGSSVSRQLKYKAYPGGSWSTEDLEKYLNDDPFPEHEVAQIKDNGADVIILWKYSG